MPAASQGRTNDSPPVITAGGMGQDLSSSALGRQIERKLDELRQLDARLEQRIEHLSRTESNLRRLIESLQGQVSAATPLIGQLDELRRGAAGVVETALTDLRDRVDAEMAAACEPGARPAATGAPTGPAAVTISSPVMVDVPAVREQVDAAVAAGVEAINQRASRLDDDLNATVETARKYIDHAFASARESASSLLEAVEEKLAEVRSAMSAAPALPETVASRLDDASRASETQLDEAVQAFAAQADVAVESVRRGVAQQVERMTQLARLEIAPLLARIDDQRRLAETQVATAADAAEATLARRADELKHAAERMLELCERQLAERIASIRPRTRAALEQVEQSAQQRVTAAMEEMARALERSERQVVERIEALRPRAAEVVFQLETDLNEQLKRMEDDAVANVHWMEHRLSRRIDELAERLARVLAGELETAHAAIRTGDTAAGLPLRARPVSPVEVQIHLDPNRSAGLERPRESTAA